MGQLDTDQPANPFLVEVTRHGFVESRHRGCAVVVDAKGRLLQSWGDAEQLIIARSAMKPVYALPLISTGAAEALGCSQVELVLACSSHLGGRFHTDPIRHWLTRIGLDEASLQCGVHMPFGRQVQEHLLKQGLKPTAIQNNNSGKHAGFLTTALFLGEPVSSYLNSDHPVQISIREVVETVCDISLKTLPEARERCSAPIHALPLIAVAQGMARFSDGFCLEPKFCRAATTLSDAITAHPRYLVGEGRLSTLIIETTNGRLIVKGGSEGVFAGFDRRENYGFVLKIDDGASRAADVAVLGLLRSVGLLNDLETEKLRARFEQPVLDAHDQAVGVVRWVGDKVRWASFSGYVSAQPIGAFVK